MQLVEKQGLWCWLWNAGGRVHRVAGQGASRQSLAHSSAAFKDLAPRKAAKREPYLLLQAPQLLLVEAVTASELCLSALQLPGLVGENKAPVSQQRGCWDYAARKRRLTFLLTTQ